MWGLTYMNPILEKSTDQSREILFGLLTNCIFSSIENDCCPLFDLRNSLSIEQKYDFVMGLSKEDVALMLTQHEDCFEKKFSEEFQLG
jgi:hypothetical protein